MTKPNWSAEKITQEVQNKVNKIQEVVEDDQCPYVGSATWHEIDDQGCNWNITIVKNASGYISQIEEIIYELRKQVNIDEFKGK